MVEKHTMLVLSTAHVTYETARQMDGRMVPAVAMTRAEGWLVHAEWHSQNPPELNDVIDYALGEHDAAWIMFDRDADVIDGLPTFDW